MRHKVQKEKPKANHGCGAKVCLLSLSLHCGETDLPEPRALAGSAAYVHAAALIEQGWEEGLGWGSSRACNECVGSQLPCKGLGPPPHRETQPTSLGCKLHHLPSCKELQAGAGSERWKGVAKPPTKSGEGVGGEMGVVALLAPHAMSIDGLSTDVCPDWHAAALAQPQSAKPQQAPDKKVPSDKDGRQVWGWGGRSQLAISSARIRQDPLFLPGQRWVTHPLPHPSVIRTSLLHHGPKSHSAGGGGTGRMSTQSHLHGVSGVLT